MTVQKEPNGTWSVRCWYRNWKGERKQKTKRGFEKQKDAKQWERVFLAQKKNVAISFDELLAAFLSNMDHKLKIGAIKESTYLQKKNNIDLYIKDYFGSADIEKINTDVVNEWLANLTNTKTPHRRGSRMASGTVNIIRNLLSQVFEYGISKYGISSNPVQRSEKPLAYSPDDRAPYWSVDEFNIFYNSIQPKKYYYKVLFFTMYWSGIRIGEILALTQNDICDNKIVINKQWRYKNKKTSFATSPKTPASSRVVEVPDFVQHQLDEYISTIDGLQPTDRIFPFIQKSVGDYLTHRAKRLGLPKISLHTLRHSYSTNLLATTKDYVSASSQLGHANPKITFEFYAHRVTETARESVDKLGKLHEK